MSGNQLKRNVMVSSVVAVLMSVLVMTMPDEFGPMMIGGIAFVLMFVGGLMQSGVLTAPAETSARGRVHPMATATGVDDEDDEQDYPEDDSVTLETGRVKWFDAQKGYGFIVRENGEEAFVHYRNIRGRGHRSLTENQLVRFHVRPNERGPQAMDVSLVK